MKEPSLDEVKSLMLSRGVGCSADMDENMTVFSGIESRSELLRVRNEGLRCIAGRRARVGEEGVVVVGVCSGVDGADGMDDSVGVSDAVIVELLGIVFSLFVGASSKDEMTDIPGKEGNILEWDCVCAIVVAGELWLLPYGKPSGWKEVGRVHQPASQTDRQPEVRNRQDAKEKNDRNNFVADECRQCARAG